MNYVIAFLLWCAGLWVAQRTYDKVAVRWYRRVHRRELAKRYMAHPVKFRGWSIEREDEERW